MSEIDWRNESSTLALVACGGAIGAIARWSANELIGDDPFGDGFPWSTLIVNIVGCLIVGLLAARLSGHRWAKPLVMTGVLGGFTTMSSVAVELNDLTDAGRQSAAAVYLAATLAGGIGAVIIGSLAAEPMAPREAP